MKLSRHTLWQLRLRLSKKSLSLFKTHARKVQLPQTISSMCTKRTQALLRHTLSEMAVRREKFVFNPPHQAEINFHQFVKWTNHLKQKHENLSLEVNQHFDQAVIAYDSSLVKEYLDKNEFDGSLSEKEKVLYDYNRRSLGESLDARMLKNPILAALIERIARTSILLERFERLVILTDGLDREGLEKKTQRGSSYITLLQEHRKCIETLVNIRWAYDQKKPQKTLAKLREMVFEERDSDI